MQKDKSESEVSRKHIVFFSDDGLLTIAGGKLTEWRAMAEDLFKKIVERDLFSGIQRDEHFSRQMFLIAIDRDDWNSKINALNIEVDPDILDHLYHQYGKGAIEILKLVKNQPQLAERILDENYFIKAEIQYILNNEPTPHLIDIFCRRMALWIHHNNAYQAAIVVSELMAKEYSWDEEKRKKEIKKYMDYIEKTVSFI